MKRLQLWLCVAFLLCSTGITKAQKLVFTPQWTAQAQFVGYYVASSKGFYQEAGLDVTIKHPSASKASRTTPTKGPSAISAPLKSARNSRKD